MRLNTPAIVAALALGTALRLGADVWDTPAGPASDNAITSLNELTPGFDQVHDLPPLGLGPDLDYFPAREHPASSYEVLIDGRSGFAQLNATTVVRTGPSGTTVLQASDAGEAIANARSIRWQNASTSTQMSFIRVQGQDDQTCVGVPGCGTYRIRYRVTTVAVPRYNNTGSQSTILLVQNSSALPVEATVWFWSPSGTLVAQSAMSLPPRGFASLASSSLAPGSAGSVTISHTAPYGSLAVKAVALEPATGFTFDSPGLSRSQ